MARPAPADSKPVPLRVRFAEFELDEANASLVAAGKPVQLAPTPFAVLCALARHPGALLTKDALLDQVWGHQFVSESVLKTAVSDLRTVLGDDPRQPRVIETVPRRGYRFIAPTVAHHAGALRAIEPAPAQRQDPSFIGRADALARLDRAWLAACEGKRSLVWVAGEPGIGKTTLIEHFTAGLGDIACARGQCVEHYGSGEPYHPVLEALGELARKDTALPALMRAVAPTWLVQLPWLSTVEERDALRRELAGVGPERMLREMGELLDRYSAERPLLLVVEDLHWSDRATLHLLDYIARRRTGARLLWLASFRLAEIVALEHPLNALRHELRLHHLCDEIVLDPFSECEVGDYLAVAAPTLARDFDFVRGLHERTDGVPLFVASVLTELGTDTAAARAQLGTLAVPENLAAIIDHSIARLDADERAVLASAAVCGVQFSAETIAGAIGRDLAWVAETCERLTRARLWVAAPHGTAGAGPERPYAFRHALFRQVLYERTPPASRALLHGQVAAALERRAARGIEVAAAELAMHYDRANESAMAVRHYADAGEAALRTFSPDECMPHVERALALLDRVPAGAERDEFELALATMRGMASVHLLGVGDEAKNAYRRAHALLANAPRHRLRGVLLHDLGFVLCQRAEYDEALTVAQRAAALPAAADDPILQLTACNIEAQVHMMQGRPRAARNRIERALPFVHAPGDPQIASVPQVMLLGLLALQLFHLGLPQQAFERMRQAREHAQQAGTPMARLVAAWHEALLQLRLGHADRVAALAGELRALVEEDGVAQGRGAWEWFQAWADAQQDDPRAAHERIRAAYGANTALGMLCGGSEVLGYAAEVLLRAGDLAAAQQEVSHALAVAESQQERVYLPQLHLTDAGIALGCGDAAAAAAAARRALAEAREQEAPWLVLLALVALCEQGEAQDADRAALATLLEQLPEVAATPHGVRARELLR